VFVIKQDGKHPQYLIGFLFVQNPCELPVTILKQTVHDVPEVKNEPPEERPLSYDNN